MKKIKEFIIREILFFSFIIFIIGLLLGLYLGLQFYSIKINEAIKVGGFVYKNEVYSITDKK